MAVTLLNPEGLPKPPADVYRHVAIATGTRHVHIAGQIARDADGNRVATGDLAGQVEQAYRNIATALASAGATFSDVVRLTFYVVDWTPELPRPPRRYRPGHRGAARRPRAGVAHRGRLALRARCARRDRGDRGSRLNSEVLS